MEAAADTACGYKSGHWPAGLINLSTWKEERPLAVNSHKIFSIKYIASIISTYQEKNVIASLRNVNSRLQF